MFSPSCSKIVKSVVHLAPKLCDVVSKRQGVIGEEKELLFERRCIFLIYIINNCANNTLIVVGLSTVCLVLCLAKHEGVVVFSPS